jgi:hypothetical protein
MRAQCADSQGVRRLIAVLIGVVCIIGSGAAVIQELTLPFHGVQTDRANINDAFVITQFAPGKSAEEPAVAGTFQRLLSGDDKIHFGAALRGINRAGHTGVSGSSEVKDERDKDEQACGVHGYNKFGIGVRGFSGGFEPWSHGVVGTGRYGVLGTGQNPAFPLSKPPKPEELPKGEARLYSGVVGKSVAGYAGVEGHGEYGAVGVFARSTGTGSALYAQSSAARANGIHVVASGGQASAGYFDGKENNYGVWARTKGGTMDALRGEAYGDHASAVYGINPNGYAGYFEGRVFVSGYLTKSVSVNSPQARSSLRSMMWIIVM